MKTKKHRPIPKRKILITITACILFAFFLWLNNTNIFYRGEDGYKLLAHRGLAQTFDPDKVDWDTNTAAVIDEPRHEYLENTIESMGVAYDYGADVVEIDVKLTKDSVLAVFHDATLEHRTDAKGEVADYTMDELRKIDIGYGYTADDGKTFPFRGKGIGLMPTIDEVLNAFPDRELLIHVKDGNLKTYEVLWNRLASMAEEQIGRITVYGEDDGIAYLRSQSATLRLLSISMMKTALLQYELIGFTGYIPKSLHNMELHLPLNYAKYLWGWPNKFIERMASVNTRVVIVAGNGRISEGFDTPEHLALIPEKYNGYVWTNKIDIYAER